MPVHGPGAPPEKRLSSGAHARPSGFRGELADGNKLNVPADSDDGPALLAMQTPNAFRRVRKIGRIIVFKCRVGQAKAFLVRLPQKIAHGAPYLDCLTTSVFVARRRIITAYRSVHNVG